MDHYEIIAEKFQKTVETVTMSVDALAEGIERGSRLMVESLLADGKVLTCGNGVDNALAQLLTCNLLDRFEADRPALPALTLGMDTTATTAFAPGDIFSRQLQALGQAGDVLVCISTSRATDNLLHAVQVARERNIAVITLSHTGDETIKALLEDEDVLIHANAFQPAQLVELYTMVIHSLCGLIDYNLFGSFDRG